ncbi:MAG TPA: hypothetical protein VGM74_05855 [Burkholderiaceae bacterium]|jgi:hypothetical protein
MRVRPALWSFAIQAAGSAATVGAALLVASTLGLGAQGQFGLLRSWNDALTSAAVLGLPQSLLHLQYREQVPIAALRDWVLRYVIALAALLAVLAIAIAWWWPGWIAARLDEKTLLVLAAVVPLAAAHLLARSLVLRGVGVVPYALITALPSLLIVAALLPICVAGARGGFVWALLVSAALSAAAAAWLLRSATLGSAPEAARAPWSRRTLWTIGVETGAQNVLTAFSPALMLSTASLLGAPLADVGLVSLGLHVYQLFGVAAAYAAPQLYDRAARADRHIGSRELFAALHGRIRGRLDPRLAVALALLLLIVVVLALRFWPAGAASPWLLAVMALAGIVSMWSRLLITLMLARGAFRPLSVQALARLVCACGSTALLMQRGPASAAVPIALLVTEVLMLIWLLHAMRGLALAARREEGV